ncbi:YhjD/YihY/BrkB family envelope integrity protein [Actinoplanes sp. NPDC049548]|uniref:YhjD/YihY/BrkB family envelope integrity protein n=1 Tax=Actinoplanes sp. NPDC049548 TaxID=3155152 RepID=UPI003421BFE8
MPHRLRPPLAWPAHPWVRRATAGLIRVQIFDRSMTLAAQAFTSLFPLLILFGVLLGPEEGGRLADLAGIPAISRTVLAESLGHGGVSTFGVVGSLAVLVASTGLARALARAYAAVWAVPRTPSGPRASWRWFVAVLTLAGFAIVSRLLGWATGTLPHPHLSAAALLVLLDCGVAVLLPWLLLGGAVPARRLVAGGIVFGFVMLALRPIGSLYLPRALTVSAERYGTIGVAFTYIGWLYVIAFCLLLTAIAGQVVTEDEGPIGRLVRGPAP